MLALSPLMFQDQIDKLEGVDVYLAVPNYGGLKIQTLEAVENGTKRF